jgi:hypothetical protein
VVIPATGAKEISVCIVPILHGTLALWQIGTRPAARHLAAVTASISEPHGDRQPQNQLNPMAIGR